MSIANARHLVEDIHRLVALEEAPGCNLHYRRLKEDIGIDGTRDAFLHFGLALLRIRNDDDDRTAALADIQQAFANPPWGNRAAIRIDDELRKRKRLIDDKFYNAKTFAGIALMILFTITMIVLAIRGAIQVFHWIF